ncbi:MAG: hypothetical protein N3G21_09760 [Candidatus Hydrogenedentes bacterium]|nr:hypothetical protein [Candidatus Hydrogenedentota bacterium]
MKFLIIQTSYNKRPIINKPTNQLLLLFSALVFIFSIVLPATTDGLCSFEKNYPSPIHLERENSHYILTLQDSFINSIEKDLDTKVQTHISEDRLEFINNWDTKNKFLSSTSLINSNREPSYQTKRISKILSSSSRMLIAYNSPQYGGYGVYPSVAPSSSLPKVVLRYPSVSAPANYGISGPMGIGYPRGGFAPTYGGRAFPMQGGYFGGYADVTVISNISDMFYTIDDRLVGEFPYSFYYLYPSNSQRSLTNQDRSTQFISR